MLRKIVVHPRAVGFEQAQRFPVKVLHNPVGGSRESKHAHEAVMLQGRLGARSAGFVLFDIAEHLGHAALHHPQKVVHLEAAIFRTGIAQAVHGALVRFGKHVRHSPRIAEQFHTAIFERRPGQYHLSCSQYEQNAKDQIKSIDHKFVHNKVLLFVSRNDRYCTEKPHAKHVYSSCPKNLRWHTSGLSIAWNGFVCYNSCQ